MNRWNLKGMKALVTGGTKGIGAAIVKEFLNLGAEVCIVSRTIEDIDNQIAEFHGDHYKLFGFEADVSDPEERKKLFEFVEREWSHLDILVNNVGTNIRKNVEDYSFEEYQKIMDTNLTSCFDLSVKFYQLLKKNARKLYCQYFFCCRDSPSTDWCRLWYDKSSDEPIVPKPCFRMGSQTEFVSIVLLHGIFKPLWQKQSSKKNPINLKSSGGHL
jgi:NAD(P)-dependent dehydrogenase (short-subunit alcohol dehydrogenase family)